MNPSQPFTVNVCINLGCGDVHMSEHFLDASQVGSAGEQVRCEAMSQCMNGYISRHPCTNCIFFN